MKLKAVSEITLALLSIGMFVAFNIGLIYEVSDKLIVYGEESSTNAYIPVPFHYQTKTYYCGPAALEMVFDYYGEDIPQIEIADAANTNYGVTFTTQMRRAAHFSNLSTSVGEEMPGNITGYSARSYGYAAFEDEVMTIDDLKALINQGDPIIVLMWYGPSKVSGHYRVVVGYNETHIITHDPWNKDEWGGAYGGANTSIAYSTFLDWWWDNSRSWGLWVSPWDIELQFPDTVSRGEEIEVIANIKYSWTPPFTPWSGWSASSCRATRRLRAGFRRNRSTLTGNNWCGGFRSDFLDGSIWRSRLV
jgi:hypothetical protein